MGINDISFVTANLVAREVGYNMHFGWKQGEFATNQYFQPARTFADRFEQLIAEISAAGFHNIDLWSAHLNPKWATDKHITIAREILRQHKVRVISLAGKFGDNLSEFELCCSLANRMSVPILGGIAPALFIDRDAVTRLLDIYGLQLAIENHPERTPREILKQIEGANSKLIGTTVDTGWYATHGCDVVSAIKELGRHVIHVHIKDILTEESHITCKLERGIVPINRCINTLRLIKYRGSLSIEHEPESYNPIEECKNSMEIIKRILRS